MSEGVILAIDNGTQSVRVLAFASNGELLDKAQVALTDYQSPQAGWMEHDAAGFYDALVAACQLLWGQQKVTPKDIRADTGIQNRRFHLRVGANQLDHLRSFEILDACSADIAAPIAHR